MAEPLKNYFGPEIPQKIARMISAVYADFQADAFLHDALDGFEDLELTPRGWHLARALRRHLPEDYPTAIEILMASLGPKIEESEDSQTEADETESSGMSGFLYLPHVFFVAEYGLDDFEVSMDAQYELTQRFTAEISIRPFLVEHTDRTLARLKEWSADPRPHVRRLVSEGTRPRLPWAPRLRAFQTDPGPVLELLELLKDDPELFVRRSVANNLNDIGKDHPELLVDTARRWLKDAGEDRRWLVRHALRSAVKRGDPGALALLGYGDPAEVTIRDVTITPPAPRIGDSVVIAFDLLNTGAGVQRLLVDLHLHFVKASGRTSPKVFKLRGLELAPRQTASLRKTISLADMSTRKHYPGMHTVDVVLNGRLEPLGAFDLGAGPAGT